MQAAQIFEIRKKRDFGAVVGDTFVYFRKHFKPLLRANIIIAGPFMLLAAIYTSLAQVNIFEMRTDSSYFSTVMLNSIISNLFMMLAMVLVIAVVHAYVKIDLNGINNNEEIRTETVWQGVKTGIWKSLGIILLWVVCFALLAAAFGLVFYTLGAVFFGFMIFISIFFLIYLFFRFSFVFPAGLLDDYSVLDSFTRSWQISYGYFWNNFGIGILFSILIAMVSGFAAIPSTIFTVVSAMHGADAEVNPIWKFIVIAIQTVGTFVALLGYILPYLAYILQYYSAVEKAEGTGLLQRIENLTLSTEDKHNWGEETY